MRPTWPPLLMTGLQGMAGGIFVTLAVLGWALPAHALSLDTWRWLTLAGLALVAGAGLSSIFHMHRMAAGRFVMRRLSTSWLSREALTTGILGAAAAVTALWPLVSPVGPSWYVTTVTATAVISLGAMAVTALIYATIPAMLSWHTPLTVLSMMGAGLVSGAFLVRAGWDLTPGDPGASVGFAAALWAALVLWGSVKLLQWHVFRDARARVRAETGLGLPRGPHRLRDTGTTRAPYRTQPQVWPLLPASQRRAVGAALVISFGLLGLLAALRDPTVGVFGAVVAIWTVYVERWMFFADATHSSRIWFPSTPEPASTRPSSS